MLIGEAETSTPAPGSAAAEARDAGHRLVRLPGPTLHLLEPIGSGPRGRTWSATLGDGSQVTAKHMVLDARGSAAVTQRIEQACGLRRRQLAAYRAAIEEPGGLWVVADWDAGVPLSALPSRMRAACVLAIGLGVLKALAVLHHEGMWHGSLNAGNVLVGADGSIRLAHYGLAPADPEQAPAQLQRADLLAARNLLSGLLGIPARAPSDDRPPSRAARSPLGLAILGIAAKPKRRPTGYEASIAAVSLWESGGAMATTRRQAKACELLAAMVESARARQDGTPPTRAQEGAPRSATGLALVQAPARQSPPARGQPAAERSPQLPAAPAAATAPGPGLRRRLAWGAAVAVPTVLLTAWALVVTSGPVPRRAALAAPPAGQHQLLPAARDDRAGPTVTLAPAAAVPAPDLPVTAPGITRVDLTLASGSCLPAAGCLVRVDVWVAPARSRRVVSWSLQGLDRCQPFTSTLGGNSVTAEPGWNHVTGYSLVAGLPARTSALRAVTDSPARAASAAMEVSAQPAC